MKTRRSIGSLARAKGIFETGVRLLRAIGMPDAKLKRWLVEILANKPDVPIASSIVDRPYARILNVLTIWSNDPAYCDNSGESKTLRIIGRKPSFQALVKAADPTMDVRSALKSLKDGGSIFVQGTYVRRIQNVSSQFGGQNLPLNLLLFLENWASFLNSQFDLLTNRKRIRGATFYTVSGYALPDSKLPELRDQLNSLLPSLLEIDAWLLANQAKLSDPRFEKSAKFIRPAFGVFLDEYGPHSRSTSNSIDGTELLTNRRRKNHKLLR
jgi:hypothetical protein